MVNLSPGFLILGTNLDPFSTFLSTITFQVYSIKQTNKNKQAKIDKYERKLKWFKQAMISLQGRADNVFYC